MAGTDRGAKIIVLMAGPNSLMGEALEDLLDDPFYTGPERVCYC